MITASLTRNRVRLLAGAALGGALVVAAPIAAFAHIHVTPSDPAAATTVALTFSFSHGCADSPTTALVVDIPAGVTNVVPVADAAWTIERAIADNGAVAQVTYRAFTPVETGVKGEVSMDVRFDEDLAGADVAFPVTQECAGAATAWTQVAAEGEPEPESPAPVVTVGAVAEEDGAHLGHGGATAEQADTGVETTTAPTSTALEVAALWMAGAGLTLGAIALAVALRASRRRRA